MEYSSESPNNSSNDYINEEINSKEVVLIYPPNAPRGQVTITKGDIFRLRPGQYLNDQLIDFYLKYLQRDQKIQEKFHFFTCFFYTKLNANFQDKSRKIPGYKDVMQWTKRIDLFSKDI